MAVPTGKILKTTVTALKPGEELRDSELPGFRVRCTPQGRAIYFVQNSVKGGRPSVTVTIGQHGTWTSEQARAKAKEVLLQMSQGIDPNQTKKTKKAREEEELKAQESEDKGKTLTLGDVFMDYLVSQPLKDATRHGYDLVVRRCLGDWISLPIISINREMVEHRFKHLSQEHPAQANQAMRVLRAIFNYADAAYEDHRGRSLIHENPVKRAFRHTKWNRIARRQTVIKVHELKKWYRAVLQLDTRTSQEAATQDYLLLILFTGLRKSEAASLLWSNVDFEAKTFLVTDTKNGEDHMLPMTPFLSNLLSQRKAKMMEEGRLGTFIFPGGGAYGYLNDPRKKMAHVIKDSEVSFTLHDLRRTFATIAENLDIEGYTLKMLLNHKLSSDVTSGYLVADAERLREPMEKISAFLEEKLGITTPNQKRPIRRKIVPLRKVRKQID